MEEKHRALNIGMKEMEVLLRELLEATEVCVINTVLETLLVCKPLAVQFTAL